MHSQSNLNKVTICLFVISFILSLYCGVLVYCSYFFVHESGHIIFGSLGGVYVNGTLPNFEIGNWMQCPAMPYFMIPQQTRMTSGQPTIAFVLGGIILTEIVAMGVAAYLYLVSKQWKAIYLLIPLFFLIHEIIGNFLCGTDNFDSKPLEICRESLVQKLTVFIAIPVIILASIIIFLRIIDFSGSDAITNHRDSSDPRRQKQATH